MGYEDKLRRLCATNGLTHQQLGERVGLKKSTISRILSGQQPPKLLEAYRLAQELGVSLDFLVSEGAEGGRPDLALVELTDEELTLLKTARILGIDVAMRRLLNAPTSTAEARASQPLPEPPRR